MHERAERRRSKNKAARRTATKRIDTIATAPTLAEELHRFKTIAKHILHHDPPPEQNKMFEAEKDSKWKRLAPLGVHGHQPALEAFIQTSEEERKCIRLAAIYKGDMIFQAPPLYRWSIEQMSVKAWFYRIC